jgi:ribonuclease HII
MLTCGIDEVGRGCLAGDVTACAVVFHSDPPEGVRDSKAMSPARRRELDVEIRRRAHVSIGTATVREIEAINILQATMLAMSRAFDGLPKGLILGRILVDGNRCPKLNTMIDPTFVIGGDALEVSIGAASICAKVERDAVMDRLHAAHPGYDWASNKGYGSPRHLSAIESLGPTDHHRMTFAPLRQPTLDL